MGASSQSQRTEPAGLPVLAHPANGITPETARSLRSGEAEVRGSSTTRPTLVRSRRLARAEETTAVSRKRALSYSPGRERRMVCQRRAGTRPLAGSGSPHARPSLEGEVDGALGVQAG